MNRRNSAEHIGFVITGAVLSTVLAVVALTTGSAWALVPALAIVVAGLIAVMTTLARLLRQPGDDGRASAA